MSSLARSAVRRVAFTPEPRGSYRRLGALLDAAADDEDSRSEKGESSRLSRISVFLLGGASALGIIGVICWILKSVLATRGDSGEYEETDDEILLPPPQPPPPGVMATTGTASPTAHAAAILNGSLYWAASAHAAAVRLRTRNVNATASTRKPTRTPPRRGAGETSH
jgi:hypothetical protein